MSDALLTCPPTSGSHDSLHLLAVISKNDVIEPNTNLHITVPSGTSVILISIFIVGNRLSFVGSVTPKKRVNFGPGSHLYSIYAIFESDNDRLALYVDDSVDYDYTSGSNVLLLCF